jgi:hypothetical protein
LRAEEAAGSDNRGFIQKRYAHEKKKAGRCEAGGSVRRVQARNQRPDGRGTAARTNRDTDTAKDYKRNNLSSGRQR